LAEPWKFWKTRDRGRGLQNDSIFECAGHGIKLGYCGLVAQSMAFQPAYAMHKGGFATPRGFARKFPIGEKKEKREKRRDNGAGDLSKTNRWPQEMWRINLNPNVRLSSTAKTNNNKKQGWGHRLRKNGGASGQ